MSKFIGFDEAGEGNGANGKGGAPFKKLRPGRQRIRFLGQLVEYDDWMFAKDGKPTAKVMSHALADGELAIVKVPKTVRDAIRDFAEGDEALIAGAEGREFVICARGEMLNRRYTIMAGDKVPIPEGLDIEALDRELLALGKRLEGLGAGESKGA